MYELSESERAVFDSLGIADENFAFLRTTTTGLAKSIFDATKQLRVFLANNALHDFSKQHQGPEHKVQISGFIKSQHLLFPCSVSLNRPLSGNGDPRLWIPEIKEFAGPEYVFCFYISDLGLTIAKLTSEEIDPPEVNNETFTPEDTVTTWSRLGQLWERATGGSGVAARPGANDVYLWPTGPTAAGVDTAVSWFNSESKIPKFLFLVGGPGGGKSYTASKLVENLQEINIQNSGLAHRSHSYTSEKTGQTYLVNDATIGSDDYSEFPLAHEILDCLTSGSRMIACVNRGILVEESKTEVEQIKLGQKIIEWVASLHSDLLFENESPVRTVFETDYLKFGEILINDNVVANLTAVYVDACSLLEKVPASNLEVLEESEKFVGDPYSIQTYSARTTLELGSFPAGSILKQTIESFKTNSFQDENLGLLNPFYANLESLSKNIICQNLLSVARAAEIASSTKFTYREMWGYICRALIGNAPNVINSNEIEALVKNHQPISANPLENFNQVRTLAGYRFSQAIFGAGNETSNDTNTDPVLRLTKTVDPILDSQPGIFDGTLQSGWATPIVDAFSGPLTEGSPLQSVLQLTDKTDSFSQVITDFDRELDKYFVEAMQSEKIKDSERSKAISWYSMYISRLYAVSNGITAFYNEITNWLDLWKMSPNFPSDVIEKQFTTLIRPPRLSNDLNSSSLLPIFDSRTEPLRGDNARSKLAIRVNDVRFKTNRKGDSLFLYLEDHTQEVSKILLDFALVREALSCIAGNPGVTELSRNVAPRLERVRAASLVPSRLSKSNEFRIVTDGNETTFSLESSSN